MSGGKRCRLNEIGVIWRPYRLLPTPTTDLTCQCRSNHMLSQFAKSGFARSTIRNCGQTIEPKIHTCRFGGENENSSGSSQLDQLNTSCRSMPPSRTLSTSNAISFLALSSRRFGPRHLSSGARVASQSDSDHDKFRPTATVNVSMPPR